MNYPKVKGYCPMGCGQTLFVGEGGYITCSWAECPNPGALSDIVNDALVSHLVTLRPDTFSITHPLRERLDGDLHECGLERYLVGLDGPPRQPGRYLVDQSENGWRFEPVYTSDEIAHRIGVSDE